MNQVIIVSRCNLPDEIGNKDIEVIDCTTVAPIYDYVGAYKYSKKNVNQDRMNTTTTKAMANGMTCPERVKYWVNRK
jgi:hypothetical protein